MSVYQIGNSDLAVQAENDASGNPIYVGEAKAGADTSATAWRIKKITYDADGNFLNATWASGTANFDKVWDDRSTAYTYS